MPVLQMDHGYPGSQYTYPIMPNNTVAPEEVIFVSRYETLLLELLRRLDEKADRIAVALEKMSRPCGQDREAIERIVDDRVKRMLSDSLQSSSHTRAW